MIRAVLVVLLLLGGAGELVGQTTTVFRGRLVHLDGLSTANLTVAYPPYGSGVTNASGVFATALPAQVDEITIRVVGHDWTVLYPAGGRVPIPRDPAAVVEVIVGESVEAAVLRHFAERHLTLVNALAGVRAGNDEIRDILQSFVRDVAERLEVDSLALRNQVVEAERKRAEHYAELSTTIRSYILAAKDLKNYFQLYGRIAFSDREVYLGLHAAAEKYTGAFEKLSNERLAFESAVATYWPSEELRSDLRGLFDYALSEIHGLRFLQLNESLVVMHQALWAGERDRRSIGRAQEAIDTVVRELDLRLPELDRRAQRVLEQLLRG